MATNIFEFGQGIKTDVWYVTEFRYTGNMVHVVAQKGAKVQQFEFTTEALEDAGVTMINNLNNLLK